MAAFVFTLLVLFAAVTHVLQQGPTFDAGRALKVQNGSRAQLEPAHAAVADINGDGLPDLVVANGLDANQEGSRDEPLVVYFNRGNSAAYAYAPFANGPNLSLAQGSFAWRSTTKHEYTQVCPIDLDNDGCIDIAATHIQTWSNDENGASRPTVVSLFKNKKSASGACLGLQEPPTELAASYHFTAPNDPLYATAWSCAVGDIDADGDDDLGVAEAFSNASGTSLDGATGLVAVFANTNGTLSQVWQNGETDVRHAYDLAFSDMDLDGRLDLVGSMEGVRIYRGAGAWFDTSAVWTWPMNTPPPSGKGGFTAGIETKWLEAASAKAVVVAANNWSLIPPSSANAHLIVFTLSPTTGLNRYRTVGDEGGWDDVTMQTFDPGNDVDVVGVEWPSTSCEDPYDSTVESASIFWNIPATQSPSTLQTKLGALVQHNILGQAVFPWEFDASQLVAKTYSQDVPAGTRFVSFSGHDAPMFLTRVAAVTNSANTPVRFRYTPGNDWLAILDPPTSADTLTVQYVTSLSPDLVVVDGCGYVDFFRSN